jgi:hypothetical protein
MVARPRTILILALLLATPRGAAADDRGLVARSRAHFEAGRALHRLGRFAEAAREFEAAYVLMPRPEMLMNIGTAHWRAGNLRQAQASYSRFLDEADAADPARRQAERSVFELARQIAEAPAPTAEARAVEAEPAAPSTRSASAPVVVDASRRDLTTAPPPRSRPRIVLWSTSAAVAVVGVALGLGLGFGLGLQPSSAPPTALGSVRFGQ